MHISARHEWCGQALKDIRMESTKLIIMIIRGQEAVIPSGDTVLQAGDVLVMNESQAKPHGSFSPLNSPEDHEPISSEEPADHAKEQTEIPAQNPDKEKEEEPAAQALGNSPEEEYIQYKQDKLKGRRIARYGSP